MVVRTRPAKMSCRSQPGSYRRRTSSPGSLRGLPARSLCVRCPAIRPGSAAGCSPGILDPAVPPVLPADAGDVKVAAGARRDAGARVELDGITPVDRERGRKADARVLLEVVTLYAVDGRAPAAVVRAVESYPDAGLEAV